MTTKELILETAREIISEVGFHRTTTAKLARKAGISEGTIYRHFESKEEILLEILKQLEGRYEDFIGHCREIFSREPLTVERMLELHLEFVAENESDIKIVLGTYGILESCKQAMGRLLHRMGYFVEDCLKQAREQGVIRDVPLRETAMTLVTLLFGITRARIFWPELDTYSNEAIEFCRRSIVK